MLSSREEDLKRNSTFALNIDTPNTEIPDPGVMKFSILVDLYKIMQ